MKRLLVAWCVDTAYGTRLLIVVVQNQGREKLMPIADLRVRDPTHRPVRSQMPGAGVLSRTS
jgi:hypothetical protein